MLPLPAKVISQALDFEIDPDASFALPTDGSDRQYFRILSKDKRHSLILMQLYADLDRRLLSQENYPWVHVTKSLSPFVRTPHVRAVLKEEGAILIEDFGDSPLKARVLQCLEKNASAEISSMYHKALEVLVRFLELRKAKDQPWAKVVFTRKKFFLELIFFKEKFLERCLSPGLSFADQRLFIKEALDLCEYIASRERFFCHRDFHSNNLMVIEGGEIGVLDFQDARLGPLAYDLVSLCFDSYVPFSLDYRLKLCQEGLTLLQDNLSAKEQHELLESWPACLLQRQLKAIGSFGFLTLDKKKGDYLKNTKPALSCLSALETKRWPFLSKTLPNLILDRLNL